VRPRVGAVMIVRDEASILALSLGHLLSLPVDRILVLDNGSTDATPAILANVARLDRRLSWRAAPGPFAQDEMTSALAAEARAQGADWILPVDADEFLHIPKRGFDRLDQPSGTGAWEIGIRNFVRCRLLAGPPVEAMIFSADPFSMSRDAQALVEGGAIPFVRSAYPPKHIFRAVEGLRIHRGAHGADGIDGVVRPIGAVFLHAPIRSPACLVARGRHGRRLAEIDPDPATGWHLRRLDPMSPRRLRAEWRANSTMLGGLGVRLDWRLRRIVRAQREFARAVSP
jgi:hypothetical protein